MYTNKLLTPDVIASKQYALHSAIGYLEQNMEKLNTNKQLFIAKIIESFGYNRSTGGQDVVDWHLGQVFTEDGGNAILARESAYVMFTNNEEDAYTLANWYKKFNSGNNTTKVVVEEIAVADNLTRDTYRTIIFDEHAKLLVELNKLNEFLEALATQGY